MPGSLPSDLPEGWDSSKVADVVEDTANNRKAPIPVGYTASKVTTEDEISEGLVIYQTATAVTGEPNSEAHITAMEGINQYVWIPVDDINDMIMCKKNGSTGTDGSTTTCNLVYDVSSNEITCQTHGYITSTELIDDSTSPNFIDTTGLAGRLYATDCSTTDTAAPFIYTTSMAFTEESKAAHKFKANSTYREPDLVTDKDNSNYQLVLNESSQALDSANALKHQLNNKFIEMAKSVAKYGGFYISRFEPSYDSENSIVISKKNKAVLTTEDSTSGNYIRGDKWYGLYNKTLNGVEKGESVDSHMIWGCQYDQVIKFLGTEAQTGHLYQTPKQEKTGYDYADDDENPVVDQDILNNIYDLEANNNEFTAQAYGSRSRVNRGSNYYGPYYSEFEPASYRISNSDPTSCDDYVTTRPTLYIAL